MLAQLDSTLLDGSDPAATRDDVIEALLPYVDQKLSGGVPLNHMTRHILGLYQGVPGARKFRRHLSENAYKKGAGIKVLEQAFAQVRGAAVTATARVS